MTDVTWNPAGDDDTSFGPLTAHNVLGGRTAADAHPAAAVSYDNDVSGLTGDTVQEAIDELATSGGAVASVNGETGVVVLDAADVGAVPTARTITAGTGLTGGGDLSADRTISADLSSSNGAALGTAAPGVATTIARADHVHPMPSASDVGAALAADLAAHEALTTAAHGGIVASTDPRLTDARTPLAHAVSHQDGGSDELALDGTQITTGTVAPGRLGSGTPSASKVLTGDGVWRPRSMTPTAYSGTSAPWAATNVGTSTGNGGMNVAYRMCFLPIELSARLHDVLSVVTTASGAGTSWEFGVYDLLDNMEPGVQVESLGTLDMGVTAGALQLPVAHTPARPGWWYVGIKVTAFGTAPTVRIAAQTGPAPLMPGWPHRGPLGDTLSGLAVTTGLAAGPLPATAPAVNSSPLGLAVYSSALPIAYMRCA